MYLIHKLSRCELRSGMQVIFRDSWVTIIQILDVEDSSPEASVYVKDKVGPFWTSAENLNAEYVDVLPTLVSGGPNQYVELRNSKTRELIPRGGYVYYNKRKWTVLDYGLTEVTEPELDLQDQISVYGGVQLQLEKTGRVTKVLPHQVGAFLIIKGAELVKLPTVEKPKYLVQVESGAVVSVGNSIVDSFGDLQTVREIHTEIGAPYQLLVCDEDGEEHSMSAADMGCIITDKLPALSTKLNYRSYLQNRRSEVFYKGDIINWEGQPLTIVDMGYRRNSTEQRVILENSVAGEQMQTGLIKPLKMLRERITSKPAKTKAKMSKTEKTAGVPAALDETVQVFQVLINVRLPLVETEDGERNNYTESFPLLVLFNRPPGLQDLVDAIKTRYLQVPRDLKQEDVKIFITDKLLTYGVPQLPESVAENGDAVKTYWYVQTQNPASRNGEQLVGSISVKRVSIHQVKS